MASGPARRNGCPWPGAPVWSASAVHPAPAMFALAFPTIDPTLIEIGPFAIRWYALAYIGGILLGYFPDPRTFGVTAGVRF